MFDLNTSYKNYNEQAVQDKAHHSHAAAVLIFPYKANGVVPVAPSDDIIEHRMSAPLCSSEMTAVLDMIKHQAKHSGQAIWITTGIFLTAMGIEDLDNLRRCDFVRAVENLVAFTASAQARKAMQ